MKKYFYCYLLIISLSANNHLFSQQSVAINTDGSAPNSSALLDIKSTTKGLLMPRMTSAQRSAIVSPAQGLAVFDITTNSFWYYNGSAWTEINLSGSSSNYWTQDGGGNMYNNNTGRVAFGTSTIGPGYVNVKVPLSLSGLFMSETGTTTADYMSIGVYTGGGTTSTRFGSILGNFGNGFQFANQSNGPIMFQTSTSERMRITATGNVGINTLAPTSLLEVKAATGGAGITLTDGTGRLSTYVNSTNVQIGTTTNHSIFFFTNSTNGSVPLMTLSTAGNVGIGGQIASTKLEVATNDASWGMTHYDYGSGVSVGTYVGSNVGWIATKSNSALCFATSLLNTNNFSQMMLNTNGNLAVGYGTPPERLSVFTSSNSFGLIHTDNIITVGTYVGAGGGWFGTKSNHPLYLFTNNGGSSLSILTNGNVGIGTVTPGYKLSVNGSIQSKEVRVETGWADYVFDHNYSLQPLSEVEQFIQTNKHLPGIPSADNIRKNGLAVGEMQTKMMEKIEELTIYVIELEKQINELKLKADAKK
jgi:hypothetical protein